MKSKKFSHVFIGSAIAAVLSGSVSIAKETGSIKARDNKTAEFVTELVQNGYLKIDELTGRLQLQSSVYSILKEYGGIKAVTLARNASQTTGGGGGCYST